MVSAPYSIADNKKGSVGCWLCWSKTVLLGRAVAKLREMLYFFYKNLHSFMLYERVENLKQEVVTRREPGGTQGH